VKKYGIQAAAAYDRMYVMASLVENTKARFDYEIMETYEAGIELAGFEVKALKNKKGSLDGAYVIIRGGEAFIVNMHISPYQVNNTPQDYDPRRLRRLLLSKAEIAELVTAADNKGLTIVPISVYNKGTRVKLSGPRQEEIRQARDHQAPRTRPEYSPRIQRTLTNPAAAPWELRLGKMGMTGIDNRSCSFVRCEHPCLANPWEITNAKSTVSPYFGEKDFAFALA
jgi:SsrA-binding protein